MDPTAERHFREFVESCTPALLRRAYLLTGGDRDAAKDLLQTALAKTAMYWHRVDDPQAFVRTLMYRQQVSWWRKGWHRFESTTEVLPDGVTADPAALTDLKLTVRAALRRLTARQRAVLFLRYFEDLPEAEVAAILECGVGTVRSTCHRALARLRVVAPELTELRGSGTARAATHAIEEAWR